MAIISIIGNILLQYVCPTLGCIMASAMFAAPVRDLRHALVEGSLASLNPFPWVMMTGNCLGWVVYAYYTKDPFVLAANLPGLVLSIWLNSGAAKLQYKELTETRKRRRAGSQASSDDLDPEHWNASPRNTTTNGGFHDDGDGDGDAFILRGGGGDRNDHDAADEEQQRQQSFVLVPQEKALLYVLLVWSVVIVWVGWFSKQNPATTVGIVVNINLVFFYGAPLKTMWTVIDQRNSESIHVPTMVMNWANTSFWIAYGFARRDYVIIVPNAAGLFLGLLQGLLCFLYPRTPTGREAILQSEGEDDEDEPELSPEDHHDYDYDDALQRRNRIT